MIASCRLCSPDCGQSTTGSLSCPLRAMSPPLLHPSPARAPRWCTATPRRCSALCPTRTQYCRRPQATGRAQARVREYHIGLWPLSSPSLSSFIHRGADGLYNASRASLLRRAISWRRGCTEAPRHQCLPPARHHDVDSTGFSAAPGECGRPHAPPSRTTGQLGTRGAASGMGGASDAGWPAVLRGSQYTDH